MNIQRNNLSFGGTGPQQPTVEKPKVFLKGGQTFVEQIHDGEGRNILLVRGVGEESKQLEINLDDLTANLQELKANQGRFLKTLDQQLKTKFESIVTMVNALYETPAYDFIHARVAKVFSDSKAAVPGTVGAYFVGCMLPTNFSGNPGCTAVCSSGVPPPKSVSPYPFCDKTTFLFDNDRTFHILSSANGSTDAYVYMADNLPFRGFTPAEASQLKGMNINKVKLVRYAINGTQYVDLTTDFVPLEQTVLQETTATTPSTSTDKSKPSKEDSAASNATVIILVILLILLILAICWQVYQRRY